MKLKCESSKFNDLFGLAASIAATRDVKPILQGVKVSAGGDGVFLQATDTELGIRLAVDGVEVMEKGETILPTKRMKSILAETDDENFVLSSKDDKVNFAGARCKFALATFASDEFPDVEKFDEAAYYKVDAKVFRELIRRTSHSTDADNTKYALGGVLLVFNEGAIDGVATDGRRLAYQGIASEKVGESEPDQVILPKSALKAVERLIGTKGIESEMIEIAVSKSRALLRYGNTVLFTRLVEGRFPRWQNIIPTTEEKQQFSILAGAFLQAVKQAAIVTTDKAPGIIMTVGAGKMVLQGSGAEVGESSVEVPVSYDAKEITTKLDPKFLLDFLSILNATENVTVYGTENEPWMFTTGDGYKYVIMPMG